MKSSSKLFIFTGVALALVAVLMAITMSSGGNKADGQEDKDPGKVKVVKAAVDLEPFAVLAMSDVVVEEMDADQVPADAATDASFVVGQAYKIGASAGDVLLNSQLQPPGISNLIAEGMRATSLYVDTQGMMSGLIMEGDYVDVVFHARIDLQRVLQAGGQVEVEEDGPYSISQIAPDNEQDDVQQVQGAPGSEFTIKDGGANLEPVAKIVVQNVKILRVIAPGVRYDAQGQEIQGVDDNTTVADEFGQLILEVTPQQAEMLTFAQDQNHAYEILVRSEGDTEIVETTGITFTILVTDETWSMPYPQPVTSSGDETIVTPAEETPAADDAADADS
ncbi:MAG: Flp pilus assembly protein CpaB [Chloroflexota bacterium]|nr:Flp pilus assembly protein CpaB [Chloroflexota bacterium]